MKKNEIALLMVIVIVAALSSYFLLGAILKPADNQKKSVKVVEEISATVDTPSTKIFNTTAIDPAIKTVIGDSSNQQPFSQTTLK
jgi:hypothetical protein